MARPEGVAKAVAIPMYYAPRSWGTRDDELVFLCQGMTQQKMLPVLVFSGGRDVPGELRRRYEASGAVVAHLDYDRSLYGYYAGLKKLVEQYHIELAHIRFFHMSSAAPWLARLAGIRHVVLNDMESGLLRARGWKRKLVGWRAQFLTHPAERLIAISEFVKQRLVGLGIEGEKITVVYNGVDVERFAPLPPARQQLIDRYGIRPEELILLTATFLHPWKHPETIVQACGRLKARGVPVRLLVAGDGIMMPQLQQLCDRLGLADQVHLLGYVADTSPLFQGCDVFVLASVGEAFGIVLIEAMGCRVPVVAARSGGIPEIVVEGETGLLVPPEDPAAMAEAIHRLAAEPDLRRRMGECGRQRVFERFRMETFVDRMVSTYQSF